MTTPTGSCVFDIEADGLTPTKIHCLSAFDIGSTTSYTKMRKFFTNPSRIYVGHNIQRYDIPAVERLLDIKVVGKLVDTLALSWYLFPDRLLHGLESWGEYFGVPKPPITDWDNLSPEEYIHRCEEDVRINQMLWDKCWSYLLKLYGSEEKAWRLVDYLSFKMDCAREQERLRWKLDVVRCQEGFDHLSSLKEEKVNQLKEAMPRVEKFKTVKYPAKPYKKDGSMSAAGIKWHDLLKENNLPDDHKEDITYVSSTEQGNPNSPIQIKSWLVGLGWIPRTFKYKRNKETNEFTAIPQINLEHGAGICGSIKDLYVKEPNLELLDGLSVLTHRISILSGFLEVVDEDGYVQARVQGLTNTLRFKHRVVVNLPSVDKPYGELIRGCLTCPDGYELIGSDMSSLEDRTKQHYMMDFDPEYVKEMNTEGFDPHLDIGVLAGMMTQKQADAYKEGDKSLNHVRHNAKQVNYSCTYGITPAGLERNTGMPMDECIKLHTTYWKRNWSIEAIADSCKVRKVNGQDWLFNPVSELWYTLRSKKDRFSTLNQGTGVYCFDTWVKQLRSRGVPILAQMHDEVCAALRLGRRERATRIFREAIDATNDELKLNRELDISIDFAGTYAGVH